MNNLRIASANGFTSLSKANVGVLRNKGWELNAYTSKFAKVGKFSMKLRGNIAQNFNEVEEMDPLILEALRMALRLISLATSPITTVYRSAMLWVLSTACATRVFIVMTTTTTATPQLLSALMVMPR